MVTRQKNTQTDGKYDLLGDPLVNADGEDYEYNLYKIAMRNYQESPSAGFEQLRLVRKYQHSPVSAYDRRYPLSYAELTTRLTEEGTNSAGNVKRPATINEVLPKVLNKYGINTPIRIAHFFGQMAAETGRFDSLVELGSANYFAEHYDPGTDQGRKLGNTQVGDGARFKGRGSIHLTGRSNYDHYSKYRQGSRSNHFTIEPNNRLG